MDEQGPEEWIAQAREDLRRNGCIAHETSVALHALGVDPWDIEEEYQEQCLASPRYIDRSGSSRLW